MCAGIYAHRHCCLCPSANSEGAIFSSANCFKLKFNFFFPNKAVGFSEGRSVMFASEMLNSCLCFDEVSLSFTLAHLLGGIACTRARDTEPIHHTLGLSRPSPWPLMLCKMVHSLLVYKLDVQPASSQLPPRAQSNPCLAGTPAPVCASKSVGISNDFSSSAALKSPTHSC